MQSKHIDPQVFEALADTFIASLTEKESKYVLDSYEKTIDPKLKVSKETLGKYLNFKATDVPNLVPELIALVDRGIPEDQIILLKLVSAMLKSAPGTFILCGPCRFAAFVDMTREEREQALLRLANSPITKLRALFGAMAGVCTLTTYGMKNDSVMNVWNLLKYPGPVPEHPKVQAEKVWRPKFIPIEKMAKSNGRVSLSCDVVVVGSGPGGGVLAAELSKAGYKVIVVEKAKYVHPSDLPLTEVKSFEMLFDRSGALMTECGSLRILAGSSWGGGSTVNWSCCLQPPTNVREEWAKDYGLDYFTTPKYQRALDIISQRLGVSTDKVKHNVPNQLLLDGCKVMGYNAAATPQNTAYQDHECGFCTFGCPYGVKQSSALTWLKDAAEAGCEFLDGVFVERIIHVNGVAAGIVGKIGDLKLTIHSQKVVVACGSVQTPALLMRSQLKNPHIGKHLRLHPVTVAMGVYPDKDVRPHHGSIMTTVSNVGAYMDDKGYGVKIEVTAIHPSMFGTLVPWSSAKEHKRLMSNYSHTATFLVLTRERYSEGTIYIDGQGQPRINWNFSPYDAKHLLAGLVYTLKIHLAAGATEVYTTQRGVGSFFKNPTLSIEETFESKEFKDYIAKVEAAGIHINQCGLFCAHQMGSCRMASTPQKGAVNPHGESFDIKGLYLSDASVFPTASGVNPMITTYSVAYSIAQFMKQDMNKSRL